MGVTYGSAPTSLTNNIGVNEIDPMLVGWSVDWNESTQVVTGSGSSSINDSSTGLNNAGAATSTARRTMVGGNAAVAGAADNASMVVFDFSKDYVFSFKLEINTAKVGAKTWVKMGDDTTADLATAGFGVVVKNLSLFGQTHDGTTLNEMDLSTDLTVDVTYVVTIKKISGTIYFYLNGSLLTSTTTNVPSVLSTTAGYIVAALDGAAGATAYGAKVGCVSMVST